MVFVGSLMPDGQISGVIRLEPGQSVPVYEAEAGAVGIVAAASGGCTQPGCFSELTISLGGGRRVVSIRGWDFN
jgi:hypothetical protein